MMKSRKGQAAMEFLMTYGWAILVVLAAIAALAYFGVLSPDKLLPEKCTLSPGMSCDGFKVTTNSIQLVIRNGMGKDITINNVTVGSCSVGGLSLDINNGRAQSVTLTGCNNGQAGRRFDGDILIFYTEYLPDGQNITKTNTGQIAAKIE